MLRLRRNILQIVIQIVMSIIFLNHDAADAAIRGAGEYADYLRSLAASLHFQAARIGSDWQGVSYDNFKAAIDAVVRDLNQAADDSETAQRQLSAGKADARDDERAAERRAALNMGA